VLVQANGSTLRLKSAWAGWRVAALPVDVGSGGISDDGDAFAQAAVDTALEVVAARSGVAAGAGAMDVLVSDATHLVLVTAGQFSASTRVLVGGQPCDPLWLSADGRQLHVTTPPLAAVCAGAGGTDCGYRVLTVSSSEPTQANFSCPPFCPGLLPGTIPAVVAGQPAGVLLPVALQAGALPAPADAAGLNAGLYFTGSCVRAGFSDPSTGACTNVSHPDFGRCGFGSGSDCSRCPAGAACPGGPRAWPLPGFFSSSDASAAVTECAPPNGRCVGWNATLSAVQCGVGYRQRSFGCGACDSRYFLDFDGACPPCPPNIQLWDIARPLLSFFGALMAVTAAFYAVLVAVARAVGGSVAGGARRMIDFMAYAASMIQLIAQVGQAASPGLPPALRAAYGAINAFQFAGIALPPACIGGSPFTSSMAQFYLVLGCMALTAVLIPKVRRSDLQRRARLALGKPLFTILLLLYPSVTNAALRVVTCTTTRMSGRGFAGLDSDGRAVAPTDMISVSVLRAEPYYVCYEGTHRAVGCLAWVVLVVHSAGYPLATLLWVRRRITAVATGALPAGAVGAQGAEPGRSAAAPAVPSLGTEGAFSDPAEKKVQRAVQLVQHTPGTFLRARSTGRRPTPAAVDVCHAVLTHPTLAPFTAGDYRASVFWFRHVDLAALAWLSLVLVLWAAPTARSSIINKAIATAACPLAVLALLWWVRPYPPTAAWKLPVRSLALLVTVLAAACNCVTALGVRPVAVEALSVAVVVLCCALLTTLVVAFGYSAVAGARTEGQTGWKATRDVGTPTGITQESAGAHESGGRSSDNGSLPSRGASVDTGALQVLNPLQQSLRVHAGLPIASALEPLGAANTNPLWQRAAPSKRRVVYADENGGGASGIGSSGAVTGALRVSFGMRAVGQRGQHEPEPAQKEAASRPAAPQRVRRTPSLLPATAMPAREECSGLQ
jgi:hypothetical protein